MLSKVHMIFHSLPINFKGAWLSVCYAGHYFQSMCSPHVSLRCSDGYSGPACIPASSILELREEFNQYPLDMSLWSLVSGDNGNLLSRCGRLTGTYRYKFPSSLFLF